jgi:hypothetical protein
MRRQDVGNIGFSLMGDVELGKLFDELQPKIQNNIVKAGYKKAGDIILQQAKSNFKSSFQNAGKMNFLQYFKNLPLQTKIGEKIGVTGNKAYILKFLNYGTIDRHYTTRSSADHFTGMLKATDFFTNAVEQTKDVAMDAVQKSIVDSMNKTVEKYNKL